jgi:hypothetical protein
MTTGRITGFTPEFPYTADDDDPDEPFSGYDYWAGLRWARELIAGGMDAAKAAQVTGLDLHALLRSLAGETFGDGADDTGGGRR